MHSTTAFLILHDVWWRYWLRIFTPTGQDRCIETTEKPVQVRKDCKNQFHFALYAFWKIDKPPQL